MFLFGAERSCGFQDPLGSRWYNCSRYDAAKGASPDQSVGGACIEIRQAIQDLYDVHHLSGSWTHSWAVDGKPPGQCDGEASLELLQLGSYVRGTFLWNNKKWTVLGHIDGDRYLTAEYRANVKHGYFGTLHMVIAPTSATIAGRWAGWSSSKPDVNSGRCTWTLR